jgi:hypothetical protein
MRFGCDVVLLMAKLWVLKGGELIVMKLLQNCMRIEDLTLHLLPNKAHPRHILSEAPSKNIKAQEEIPGDFKYAAYTPCIIARTT